MKRRFTANQQAAGVSLFPFLAVLLCTMGAMIIVLVVIARHTRVKVAEEARRSAAAGAGGELAAKSEELEWKIDEMKKSRESTQKLLADKQTELSHLEEHARRLKDQLEEAAAAREHFSELAAGDARENEDLKKRLARLRIDADRTRAEIDKLRRNGGGPGESYAIIPYHGPNETHRRPIYIECRRDAIVLQPEGVTLYINEDFTVDLGPSNPLVSALRATSDFHRRNELAGKGDAGTPYPLFIIRPDGIESWLVARMAISSWGSDFGYELVGQDWKFDFPAANSRLTLAMREAVAAAKLTQVRLARDAPRLAHSTGHAVFRASQRGGIVQVDGSSGGGGRLGRGRPGLGSRRAAGGGDGFGNGGSGRLGGGGGGGMGGPPRLPYASPQPTGNAPVHSIDGDDNPYASALEGTGTGGGNGGGSKIAPDGGPGVAGTAGMGSAPGYAGGMPGKGTGVPGSGLAGTGYGPGGQPVAGIGQGRGPRYGQQPGSGTGQQAGSGAGQKPGAGTGQQAGSGLAQSGSRGMGNVPNGLSPGAGGLPGGSMLAMGGPRAGGPYAAGSRYGGGGNGNGQQRAGDPAGQPFKPGTSPDGTQADGSGDAPGGTQTDRTRTGGTGPGGTGPGGTGPGGTGPGGTGPGGMQPGGNQPGGTQPGGNQPAGAQPGGAQPGGTQPGGTQPGGMQPGGMQPGGTQAGGMAPGTQVAGSTVASEQLPDPTRPGGSGNGRQGTAQSAPGIGVPGRSVARATGTGNARRSSGPTGSGTSDPNGTDDSGSAAAGGPDVAASPNGIAGATVTDNGGTSSGSAGPSTRNGGVGGQSDSRSLTNPAGGATQSGSRGGMTIRGNAAGPNSNPIGQHLASQNSSGGSGSSSSMSSQQASAMGGGSSSSMMQPMQAGGMPSPMSNFNFGQQDSQASSKGHKQQRDKNWANPDASTTNVPIQRPIRMVCDADHLTLLPEGRGKQGMRVIPLKPQTSESIDDLVSTVWDRIDSWGTAGRNMYWRPTLIMEVEPGGQRRYAELQTLLANSGFDVHGKPRTRSLWSGRNPLR